MRINQDEIFSVYVGLGAKCLLRNRRMLTKFSKNIMHDISWKTDRWLREIKLTRCANFSNLYLE